MGDGGDSNLGLNLSETSTLRPHQRVGSQAGVLGENLEGKGSPHSPRAWLGGTRSTESTESQPGKGNSLPATIPQVAENLAPEPKAQEVEVEEEETFDPNLEPVVTQPGQGGSGGEKRKPSHDGSDERKKFGKTEAVAPLSSQTLDSIQFQVVGAGSPPPTSSSQEELQRAVASIIQ